MRKRKESDIQRAICNYLQCKGYFFWRQANVGVYDEKKKIYRMNHLAMKGVPDILCLVNGQLFGLEVKMPGGSQSEGQKLFQERMTKAGGHYFIVSSTDDIVKIGL